VVSGPVEADVTDAQILDLLQRISSTYRWVHVEKLQRFDGKDAFSKAQGES
jgi:isocitrate dehydrogenase